MKHWCLRWFAASLLWGGVSAILGCSGSGNPGGAGGTTSATDGPGPAGPNTSGPTSSSAGTGGNSNASIDCNAGTGPLPPLVLTPIASGLTGALLAKSAPDDPDRLYVVRQSGQINVIENGQTLATPFLDISSKIVLDGEEGLLGLAFHPDYKTNGRFFVHYSQLGNGDSTVMEYRRSMTDPNVADPTPVRVAFEHTTAQTNHNGGSTEFGPDGYLYISLGDGGSQHDCECDAQNSANSLGKISRIDVDGVPDANGYPAAPTNPGGYKGYHFGFRNPWRTSFDVCTGDQYIGDVGQLNWEEVNVAPASGGPMDFGWPYWEGAEDPSDVTHHHILCATTDCGSASYTCRTGPPAPQCPPRPATGLTGPIVNYSHAFGCAVIGGYVYRSSAIPALRGTYLYGDYCAGTIWSLTYANGTATASVPLSITPGMGVLSGFGQDGRGQVYVVGLDGNVSRIDSQ